MRASSPFIAKAVRAITGMVRVASSRLSSTVASRPSMPGSWISIRMRSGCSARANARPASASVALSTVCRTEFNRNIASVMLVALSSMMRTFAMSVDQLASRYGPPDFDRDAFTVELGLIHDRRHVAIQLGAVLGGDLLGCGHHDRNGSRIGMFVERLHNVEAVHLRHHQIEHDQVWQLLPRGIDCLAAAVRPQQIGG